MLEYIHPLIVHFPIALWLGALLFYLIHLARRDHFYWEAATWLHGLGILGGIAALLSGEHDEELVEHALKKAETAYELLEQHELLGKIITGYFLLLFLWAFSRMPAGKGRYLFVLLFALGIAALVFQGHLGGRLVFEFLVGTLP